MKKNDCAPSKELFSRCVKAGSRFYYIDAKQDSSGNYYMVMSESRTNAQTGVRERQRIFVYEEDVDKFMTSLSEVAVALKELASQVDRAHSDRLDSCQDDRIAALELPDVEDFLSE